MAKQSSIFSFFTKSPPLVAKPKPSSSPAEADLPSAVKKSNSSPKEEANETQQQQPAKAGKVKQKSQSQSASGGIKQLFGSKKTPTEERYWISVITGTVFRVSIILQRSGISCCHLAFITFII